MGPLPASIYWRRRVVVLAAVVAVVALIAWLMTDQGGGGDGASQKAAQAAPTQSQNQTPAQAITPGAPSSGPAAPPGGGSTGGGSTGGAGGSGGSGGSSGSGGEVSLNGGATGGGSGGSGGGTGSAGASSGGGAGGTGGGAPPVNTAEVMKLPVCTASQVALELTPTQNPYQAKDKPQLVLTVKNSSGTACRVNLGRTASAITVSSTSNERIWSSGDCPADKSDQWVQIAANSSQGETFTWDRLRSKQACATPDPAPAATGTYQVLAELSGVTGDKVVARASIRLDG
ncbi:hypothetical protein [Streptomyces sp. NRRL WC-3742]|uniref:hypothetical protein n=1 Tax=Streptomyces sp. NRRL WC-3742 TaxID=1463934 RepID=UPI00068D25DF|nr:hypothetical protein [Streptomyces sp. NRRL WC-3742]